MNLYLAWLLGVAVITLVWTTWSDRRSSRRLTAAVEQLSTDVAEIAAYMFVNDDEPVRCERCEAGGIDEIVAADPDLQRLDGYEWLLRDGSE